MQGCRGQGRRHGQGQPEEVVEPNPITPAKIIVVLGKDS